ncbi:DUF1501 domain-containing protein [Aestuariibius sp. 2305UL40-4]|uniref:DUF1501 domain-containing protein n=1 Tax=Aestuariibius violaceus TaxID=3234132 RepID=UPI00345E1CE2
MDRRTFLRNGLALGCSTAASPLLTPMALASAPWEERLIVIILRGGMDGVDVFRPMGDPAFAALRPDLAEGGLDAGPFYQLHPALAPIKPLWDAGEFGAVHAVSTPYRDKRSHFDGQDLLEAGSDPNVDGSTRDGWLNRMLQAVPGVEASTTFAIGLEQMLLTTGSAPVSRWSPDARLAISPQAQRLLELVQHRDPLFRQASAEAIAIASKMDAGAEIAEAGDEMMMASPMMAEIQRGRPHVKIAEFAADRLREDARVAAFSLNGWDTHAAQDRTLPRALTQLTDTILTLKTRLGPAWSKTCLLAMTEFGRTARQNGSGGTDHGTGGALIYAGGAVRGGQVLGDWPGLTAEALYQERDLMPTRDIRGVAAWAMHDLLGIDRPTLESAIFPGLDMGEDAKLIA